MTEMIFFGILLGAVLGVLIFVVTQMRKDACHNSYALDELLCNLEELRDQVSNIDFQLRTEYLCPHCATGLGQHIDEPGEGGSCPRCGGDYEFCGRCYRIKKTGTPCPKCGSILNERAA